MAPRVAVVTDTTSYLPAELADEHNIQKVPVQVIVSGRPYAEGIDISTHEVAEALRQWKPVSTSRPSPVDFEKAYLAAADAGAESIVSAHLSSELSGTYQTALLAAKESPIPVTVVDSRTLAMALGYAVLTGSDVAATGGSNDDVAAAIRLRASRSNLFFYVDTLDYLRRGGRMSSTSAAVGSALRIKPILHMDDGKVQMLEKARTSSKALARLADLAIGAAGVQSVDFAVHHIDARENADALAAVLLERVPGASILVNEIGAVVGAHVGPGMVAVVVSPRVI